jgi:hypothetical protein
VFPELTGCSATWYLSDKMKEPIRWNRYYALVLLLLALYVALLRGLSCMFPRDTAPGADKTEAR